MMQKQAKQQRLENTNRLIEVIAGCGRRFFGHEGRIARLSLDRRGRVWYLDDYAQQWTYTHYRGRWRHFSHGGTLKSLVERLRDYVVHGKPLPPGTFGPWPDWYCRGDLWGYQEDMQQVRDAAAELGLVSAPAEPEATALETVAAPSISP